MLYKSEIVCSFLPKWFYEGSKWNFGKKNLKYFVARSIDQKALKTFITQNRSKFVGPTVCLSVRQSVAQACQNFQNILMKFVLPTRFSPGTIV